MKALVLYETNTPLQIVDLEQQGPQAGEARVRVNEGFTPCARGRWRAAW